jgi:hypothetical protein
MFTLDGRPLALDTPFEHDGIRYPANWLRLASPEEREAIGIEEVPDPEPYDQRFYWGPGNPMDHAMLVERWTAQARATAGGLLAPSDWLVIREMDNTTPVPDAWRTWREAVRTASGVKVAAIEQTADTDELAAYITGADFNTWPSDPSVPAQPAPPDGVEPAGDQPTN